MKIHVKICGITRCEDALLAEKLGASATGFVFYNKSPRYITPEKAGKISKELGPFIAKVGVFVDEKPSIVMKTIHSVHLTAVQLHGSESQEYIKELKRIRIIKAFRVDRDFNCEKMIGYDVNTFLLDTFAKNGCYGGTGKTFDWKKAKECNKYGRIILSGGLTASNVCEAVKIVKPWAVDVSSGVEKSPGIKDSEKMNDFFTAISTKII